MKECNKFKEYFIFCNEEDFNKHVEECPECAAEYEQFNRISDLVKEVRFEYKQKRKNKFMSKVACISGIAMFTATFGILSLLTDYHDYNYYNDYNNYLQDSITEEMGYPIDNYGLIKVD